MDKRPTGRRGDWQPDWASIQQPDKVLIMQNVLSASARSHNTYGIQTSKTLPKNKLFCAVLLSDLEDPDGPACLELWDGNKPAHWLEAANHSEGALRLDVGREDELVEVDLVVLHLEVLQLDEGKPEYVPSRADDGVDVVRHRPVHKLYPSTRQTSGRTSGVT